VLLTGPGWIYEAPTYYSQQLYQRAAGSYPLRLKRSTSLPWHLQEPDLSATLSEDGKVLRIYGVNSTAEERQLHFRLTDFPSEVQGGTVYVLKDRDEAGTPEVMNSRNDAERIVSSKQPAVLRGKDFDYSFPPFSLTLLELEL
jgi:alpha-L-arabinofuranosidase